MKNIILIRHAKSDWNNENLTDFERPLNARGFRDAEFMSSRLANKGLHIDCIISSSAVRALTTAEFFAQALSMDKNSIIQHRFLYGASESQYVDIIQEFDDSLHNISCSPYTVLSIRIRIYAYLLHDSYLFSISKILERYSTIYWSTCQY